MYRMQILYRVAMPGEQKTLSQSLYPFCLESYPDRELVWFECSSMCRGQWWLLWLWHIFPLRFRNFWVIESTGSPCLQSQLQVQQPSWPVRVWHSLPNLQDWAPCCELGLSAWKGCRIALSSSIVCLKKLFLTCSQNLHMSRFVGVWGRGICSLDLSSQLWTEAAQIRCAVLQNNVVGNPRKERLWNNFNQIGDGALSCNRMLWLWPYQPAVLVLPG